jgi:hypothetical protein
MTKRKRKQAEWFDNALDLARRNAAEQRAGNAYLDKLQAGGSLPGMLRVMAAEFGGAGAGSTTTQTANDLKKQALLRAAELIEEREELR